MKHSRNNRLRIHSRLSEIGEALRCSNIPRIVLSPVVHVGLSDKPLTISECSCVIHSEWISGDHHTLVRLFACKNYVTRCVNVLNREKIHCIIEGGALEQSLLNDLCCWYNTLLKFSVDIVHDVALIVSQEPHIVRDTESVVA